MYLGAAGRCNRREHYVLRSSHRRERKRYAPAADTSSRRALQPAVFLAYRDAHVPERGEVQVDRSCAKLAAARESQLTAARPPEDRPQEHYGRPHFPHQIVWYLIAADVGGVHAHRVAAAGTPAPKAGKYPARRVHVGKLRAVMQNAFAVRQHTRRKQRERAVLCSLHPEFALQPPPAVNDELLAVCHMIISSCITVFP